MQSKIYPRTDLACERRRADTTLPGVFYQEEEKDGILKELLARAEKMLDYYKTL